MLRASLSLTQEAFAHRLGVTFTTVNRWENGKVVPAGVYAKLLDDLEAVATKKDAVEMLPAPSMTFKPERMVLPADMVEKFGGPSVEAMRELWGAVPGSVALADGKLEPVWNDDAGSSE